jgi:Zn-finger nucleic acid-binding protein
MRPKCKGVWFESDELRQAKDASEPDTVWLDFDIWKDNDKLRSSDKGFSCPQCQAELKAVVYGDSEIEVDCCPGCKGTWLDKGEFLKIMEALTYEVDTKSFTAYVSETIKQGTEIIAGPETFISEWKDFSKVFYLLSLRLYIEHHI